MNPLPAARTGRGPAAAPMSRSMSPNTNSWSGATPRVRVTFVGVTGTRSWGGRYVCGLPGPPTRSGAGHVTVEIVVEYPAVYAAGVSHRLAVPDRGRRPGVSVRRHTGPMRSHACATGVDRVKDQEPVWKYSFSRTGPTKVGLP
jgi:hypothetical protein